MPSSTEALIGTGVVGVLALAAGLSALGVGMLYLLGKNYSLVPPPASEYLPLEADDVAIIADTQ